MDPNEIIFTQPNRIWLDDCEGLFCEVDDEDYQWALQWRWTATPNSTRSVWYATRNTRIRAEGRQVKIYMHKEILRRTGRVPPTLFHTIADHENRRSLFNRRGNLRWATHSENSCNRSTPLRCAGPARE